jgi:hypothetical protein
LEIQAVKDALADTQVKNVVHKLVKSHEIQLVDRSTNQAVLKREMSLIGKKGDNAVDADLVNATESKVDPETTELLVEADAFEKVKYEINDFIKRN